VFHRKPTITSYRHHLPIKNITTSFSSKYRQPATQKENFSTSIMSTIPTDFDTAGIPLTAPLTGTLRYPATDLVELARLILTQYKTHLQSKEKAADEAGDEDASWEAVHSQEDIHEINWLIDRKRWKEDEEVRRGKKVPPGELQGLDDPKQPERCLLIIGANHKASFVYADAVKLRKETRGSPSAGSDWSNEDALLDFLVFLSAREHRGLFRTN
jgi:hypothetical protein